MQISESWLRGYVNPPVSTEELVAQLTMAGLEVDSVEPAWAVFSGVVIGEVLSTQQHPDADRLRVCSVNVGQGEPLQIVCGASNVRPGLKIPTALVGAVLPGDFKIKQSKLRGVESSGMLCSEKELGVAADASGLMELQPDAPIGADIREYLSLNDSIIEIDLTPNRADCLSIEGIAREVALLNGMGWTATQVKKADINHQGTLPITVEEKAACPRYLGRLIKGVNSKTETPAWMQERLRRSGIRSLSAVVDVTNYVLMELGQPLHAFDADKLVGGITVRMARNGESLALLNGQTITLDTEALVIADDKQPLALAGVMGGSDSAVSGSTQNIFLECAFFAPRAIAGEARRFGLHTDSSHRFERGVDATLQHRAIERATQLIVEIAGGSTGSVNEVKHESSLPQRPAIVLRRQRIEKMLGISLPDGQVHDTFVRLGMCIEQHPEGWSITPPGFRFDMAIEADLIEELARVHGYNNIPNNSLLMRAELGKATETVLDIDRVKDLLVDLGYQEAITYSFVDEDIQQAVAAEDMLIKIKNPISSDLSVMRSTLWCGLLKAALHNLNRQQNRIRLFETGLRFLNIDGHTGQQKMLSGLILGGLYPEQWGEKLRKVDFFDLKADVQAMFSLTGCNVQYVAARHTALHPGQAAQILSQTGEKIGILGMLHPILEKRLGFETPVFLFELDQDLLLNKTVSRFKPLSKYPSVSRDLALIVKEGVSADDIIASIKSSNEATIQDIMLFDLYRGKGIEEDCKSVAVSITLQNFSQTLTDVEIDAIFNNILQTLAKTIGAKLRD
ncbi:phenylalanine--tRNA ligase subunit beta [Methyloglobulus sp.]|uniref:phenylalanine--tRNA ligase subunit beta n=1 Tax=Methyloglobulus sp. TaxID=2518622 RepID=UPI003988B37F